MKLILRTKQNSGKHPLYTRMRVGGKVLWVNLRMTVDVEEWYEASKSQRKFSNYLNKKGISQKVALIEYAIVDLKSHHRMTIENLEKKIEDIVLYDKREKYIRAEKLGDEFSEKDSSNIENFLNEYVKGISNGKIRTESKEKYSKNSIKKWNNFKGLFLKFYKIKPFNWADMNEKFVDRYINYLEEKGYMKGTIKKYVSLLKTLVGVAERNGLHTNHFAYNILKSPKITDEDKVKEIYLTKPELNALYEMSLDGFEEQVRDVFLVGCFTSLRFSDFSRIKKTNIGVTDNGTPVIRMIQEKTGKKVVIPIMDDRLEDLLKKYDYNIPRVLDQSLNRTIKEICKKLSESVPSLCKKERTVLTLKERNAEEIAKKKGKSLYEYDEYGYPIKPRWALVATHTARRSCITNMYLSKKFSVSQMMSVSGHQTEAMFKKYVKLSLDEYADCVADAAVDGLF